MLKEKQLIADERKEYAEAKMKPPGDAELHRDFIKRRASLQTTLGRIYVKEGKIEEGGPLLRSAYAADEYDSAAAAILGEIEAKNGHSDLALKDLVHARLTGKLDATQQTLLESLYRSTKDSSATTLDQFLDTQYRIYFPSPFEVTKYQPSAKRSNRTVLAELFTGAGCGPCAGADLAIDGCLEKYSRQEVAVLMFHQHIPEPDPMANPADVKRFTFYDGSGVPTLALDGVTAIVGASRDDAKEKFEMIDKMIEKDVDLPAEASLNLSAKLEGDRLSVKVSAADIKSVSQNLRLQIVLAENHLRYSGENGIRFHPMVVRSVANSDENGFAIDPTKPIEYAFDISKLSTDLKTYLDNYEQRNDRFGKITFIEKKYAIDPRDLSVVAFVQDMKTKHILQAAYTAPTLQ